MTLKNGKALCLHESKDHYGGHDVLWTKIGEADNALKVYKHEVDQTKPEEGFFLRLFDRPGHAFDISFGKF